MTYRPPHRDYDPRSPNMVDPHQQASHSEYRREGRNGAETLANIIRVIVGLVITVFALHVLFVILDANQHNGFVRTVYMLAKAFVLGLGDVFTPGDALLGVVMNYGLAALVYAVIGHLVIRALRRH